MATVMGIIYFLSHQPADSLQVQNFAGLDKAVHVITYGLLAVTVLYGLQPFTRKSDHFTAAIVVVLFCLLYGISDEYHQSFIPGRHVSAWDVAADLAGALAAVAWWFAGRAPKDF